MSFFENSIIVISIVFGKIVEIINIAYVLQLFIIYQEIQQLEILCKQLYEATDVVLRSNAEKTLVQFVSSQDALPKCQMLLDRADSSYAQLLAATTLTKLIQGLTLEQRIDIRYNNIMKLICY